ncbi:MAG: serine/threonine-protein kinase, partial [Gemmatimonadetes bacterium]|nr:serine/threonine-protein kinase [Gemmatimonadota bacterium]
MTHELKDLTSKLSDRYRVERKVGAGGMATVYLAQDLKHNRRVAVKVLRSELSAAVGHERFLREIEIAAGLNHPHILPVHDSGHAGEFLYYVMPYVEGESLRDRLSREKQLGIDEALSITREVADALAYAHARGVVHRDIKPENIMLESGHAVVTDFGVAFVVQEIASDRLTGTGLSPGTPLYMSPEQAGGERQIDGRSDVYSLGCVLYEMLGGEPPFTGATAQAVMARKMMESVPSVRIVRDTVPASLERVILKSLAKTPADRFRTAGEFAEALAGRPVEQIASREREVEEARTKEKSAVGGAETRRSGLAGTAIAIFAAGVGMLTVIGFVTTKVWDLKL